MPRVKRRTKRRRTGYTDAHIRQLLTGHEWFGDAFGRDDRGTLDVDAMREAWEALRGELLPKWIAEHPGTRPYAWWVFDAPERRRRIGTMRPLYPVKEIDHMTPEPHCELVEDGKPHPFDNPERNAKVDEWRRTYPDVANRAAYKLYFGKPSCLMTADDFEAAYESEAEYLDRLELLTDDERAVLVIQCAAE